MLLCTNFQIDIDFGLKYSSSKDGIQVWDDLLVHIIDYLTNRVKDEFSLRILHDLTNSELSEGNNFHRLNEI